MHPSPTRPLDVRAYLVGFAIYIPLGVAFTTKVFNWIVGLMFPLVAFHLVPSWFRRLRLALSRAR